MATTTSLPISIPITAQVGGLSFTKPPATAVSYYKIAPSIPITFGWNFTSLYVSPTALTVSAFCASASNTYPVGPTNGVIPGDATEIVWDPWSYQTGAAGKQTPLVQGTYTLQIQDEHGPTSLLGSPGLFQYNTQMTFAMYTPQPYTPLAGSSSTSSQWQCAGCNNSATGLSRPQPALVGLVVTTLIMLISGWSLLRNFVERRERQ